MNSKLKVLTFLVVILTLLNVWLLYANNARQIEMENLIRSKNETSLSNSDPENWGFEQAGNETAKIVHPEVELPEKDLSMSVFFTDSGCGYCVDHEVALLNDFYNKFESEFNVYLLSHNESFLERLHGAEFPYSVIDPEKKLVDHDFDFSNPVAIISDSNGIVQIIHIAEKDNKEKSNHFYTRVGSLLLSLNY